MSPRKLSATQARQQARKWLDTGRKNGEPLLLIPELLHGVEECLSSDLKYATDPVLPSLSLSRREIGDLIARTIGIIDVIERNTDITLNIADIRKRIESGGIVLEKEESSPSLAPWQQHIAILQILANSMQKQLQDALQVEDDEISGKELCDDILLPLFRGVEVALKNNDTARRLSSIQILASYETSLAGVVRVIKEALAIENSSFKVDHFTISIGEDPSEEEHPLSEILANLAQEPEFQQTILPHRPIHLLKTLLQRDAAIITNLPHLEALPEFGLSAEGKACHSAKIIGLYDGEHLIGTINLARIPQEGEERSGYNIEHSTEYLKRWAKQIVAEMKRVIHQ